MVITERTSNLALHCTVQYNNIALRKDYCVLSEPKYL